MRDTYTTYTTHDEFDMDSGVVTLLIGFTRTTVYDSDGLDSDDATAVTVTWPSGATTPLYRVFVKPLHDAVLAKVADYMATYTPESPDAPERDWDAVRDERRDDPDYWRD